MLSIPLISIIIPLYNRKDVISATLDSVINQTYTNWECIVVDDGSVDGSFEIVNQYANNNPKIKLYKRPDNYQPGGCGARNYGLNVASGELICWLDSDDLFTENKLELQVDAMLRTDSDVCVCEWTMFENDKPLIRNRKFVTEEKTFDAIGYFNNIGINRAFMTTHAYLIKRSALRDSVYWNEHVLSNQDGEFFARAISEATKIVALPQTLCYYRKDSSNKISKSATSVSKLQDKINSWKLVFAYFTVRFKANIPQQYIDYATNELFAYLLSRRHFQLIERNKDMFEKQLNRYGLLKFKIKSYLSKFWIKNI